MKSALVKPQNARMSDSECGHVGLNACRFHVLKSQMQCTCYSERYYVWLWEHIFEHIMQNNEHRVIVVCIISIFIMKHTSINYYQLMQFSR